MNDAASGATRVVLVNFEFPPIAGPGIWRIYALARDLAALGHEVAVVCSDRSSWHGLRDPTLLERVPGSVRIHRVAAPFVGDWTDALEAREQSSGNRLMRGAWRRARQLLTRYAPDAAYPWIARATAVIRDEIRAATGPVTIISSGPTHITHLAAHRARTAGRTRWIMDYRDPWTSDPTLVNPGPYQMRMMRALEQRCLRACDAVVSVAPAWLDNIAAVAGDDPAVRAKLHVIRNGHDLTARRVDALRSERGPRDARLHLHFSGTLQVGTRESAMALFAAVARLRERCPDLPLPRLTFTGLHPRVQATVQQLRLQDIVQDVGYRTQDEALRLSAAADVLLVLVDANGPTRRGVIPAKTYEAVALGACILAVVPPGSDVASMLEGYAEAALCAEDPQAISQALETLVRRHQLDPGCLQLPPEQGAAALERYSRRTAALEYARLIASLEAAPPTRRE